MTDDARCYAPATLRNRDPILDVLKRHLPQRGLVLEIASGSGEHITHFAVALQSSLIFQPSDPETGACGSIDAWVARLDLKNVRPAIALDVSEPDWGMSNADAVLCINMIHIAPWSATIGLMTGAAKVLSEGGMLYLYGPYKRNGGHTAPSNAAFDHDLQSQNPEWGIRDLDAVIEQAGRNGFAPPLIEQMPANNLSLIFQRRRVEKST
jgi:Protein of unknown function (DUF938)